ncbi:hypothetical protein [Candidatus Paracaedibacter symbiosus]|uniref:hypothetical protein n=1 Tax=Candidatus Paracaedibacter symbiosus TaxID=244582 RepID=UPI0018DDE83D|nr:hypothetical protein [Candidatus Paracaedibacter symbiosus]
MICRVDRDHRPKRSINRPLYLGILELMRLTHGKPNGRSVRQPDGTWRLEQVAGFRCVPNHPGDELGQPVINPKAGMINERCHTWMKQPSLAVNRSH